jgi:hypothetical protein
MANIFVMEKSRKKSEMMKYDEKISFSLLESATKGHQHFLFAQQMRHEKLHQTILLWKNR